MKKIIIALAFIFFAKVTLGQKELLALDEHNKYIYYQVVDIPGITADTLDTRALYFFQNQYPKIKIKTDGDKITGEGKFLTYGGIVILKHENGEIDYTITVECKAAKYRYWLSSFTFTPYVRDRYGNFVPQQGIAIPLETASAKLDKRDVESYLNQTGAFCKALGDKLKVFMHNSAPKKAEVIQKVVTDKW